MDKIRIFLEDSYNELVYKVTWPTWEELLSTTRVVVSALLLLTLTVFIFDFIFGANPENSVFQGLLAYIYSLFA
ncbi:MAG: preprotein translocase subunit SecE [Sphingobacteriales bacterium]|nr:preprotein translocase subunit SecE [Sphingobacteriales bacterium]